MLTLLLVFVVLMVAVFLIAVITGLIAVSPAILVIVAFVALDVLVFKLIFGKKKKEK